MQFVQFVSLDQLNLSFKDHKNSNILNVFGEDSPSQINIYTHISPSRNLYTFKVLSRDINVLYLIRNFVACQGYYVAQKFSALEKDWQGA